MTLKTNINNWLEDLPAGMDSGKLLLHQRRLTDQNSEQKFKVLDTCRLDNNFLISLDKYTGLNFSTKNDNIVAFIPAAGAASRYMKPLSTIKDQDSFINFKNKYKNCAIPKDLVEYDEKQFAMLRKRPKALFPITHDGQSFLNFKTTEHTLFPSLLGQVFISPESRSSEFNQKLTPTSLKTIILEQDLDLCTIRFKTCGEPYRDSNNNLSLVSAGHGALARLIFKVKDYFTKAESVFIRNIDNIQGNEASAIAATNTFFSFHQIVLSAIKNIRNALKNNQYDQAEKFAHMLCEQLSIKLEDKIKTFCALNSIQINFFHSLKEQTSIDQLSILYARPVNTLGQVPNNGTDVGGTPCLIQTKGGPVKIILELPHANESDQNKYFKNPKLATYFNPVFICAEIPETNYYSEHTDHPFWIIANKTIGSDKVVYHEELLSEILGNSMTCNCTFTSLPRSTFNPHKTLEDSKELTQKSWIR